MKNFRFKKLFVTLITLFLIFVLYGCSKDDNDANSNTNQNVNNTQTNNNNYDSNSENGENGENGVNVIEKIDESNSVVDHAGSFDNSTSTFTVTFYDDDNKTVIKTMEVRKGNLASYDYKVDGTPIKKETVSHTYSFKSWDKEFTPINSDTNYVAIYEAIEKEKYYVTFMNGKTILDKTVYYEGQIPVYKGKEPTKESTQYIYTFIGWDKLFKPVTSDITFNACYSEKEKEQFEAKFVSIEDGKEVVKQESLFYEGQTPTYSGNTPRKESDEYYTYTFDDWDKELKPIEKDTKYTAKFKSKVKDNAPGLYDVNNKLLDVWIDTSIDLSKGNAKTIIDKYYKEATYIILPKSLTKIPAYSFAGCDSIKNVKISDTTTLIDNNAFENCTSLEKLTISSSVKEIGNSAFKGCESIKTLSIPETVVDIGSNAFEGCSNLSSIDLPKTIVQLNDELFANCTSLVRFTIPSNATIIGDRTFIGCSKLASINIPTGIKHIGEDCFNECFSLRSFTVNSLNSVYDSRNNCNAIIETSTNKLIAGCYSTVIPDSVVEIGSGAFKNVYDLENIYIPNSVKLIDADAFKGCVNLESISIPTSVSKISTGAFVDLSENAKIAFNGTKDEWNVINIAEDAIDPNTTILFRNENYYAVFSDNIKLYWNELQAGINKDNYGYRNAKITEDSILKDAFNSCKSLVTIVIPNNIKYIGETAFYNCSGMSSITLPNTLEKIDVLAFGKCTKLSSIVLPESLKDIEDNAFNGCSSLLNINVPDSVKYLGDFVFTNCSKLLGAKLPIGILNIGDSMFQNCSSLLEFTIPETVTTIKNYAFSNCTSLKEIIIPKSVSSIGNYAFENCSLLEEVEFDSNDVIINEGAFSGCSSIVSITLPTNIEIISSKAFKGCASLKEVYIPKTVTSIGNETFAACAKLKDIHFGGTKDEWSNISKGEDWDSEVTECTIHFSDSTEIVINKPNLLKKALNFITNLIFEPEKNEDISNNDAAPRVDSSMNEGVNSTKQENVIQTTDLSTKQNVSYNSEKQDVMIKSTYNKDGKQETISKLDDNEFENVEKVKTIIIEEGIKEIGNSTFKNNKDLIEVNIPSTIQSLGGNIFVNCDNLTTINYNGTVDQWNNIKKDDNWAYGVSRLTIICINGTKTIIK